VVTLLLPHCNIYTHSEVQPEEGPKKTKRVAAISKFIKYLNKQFVLDYTLLYYLTNGIAFICTSCPTCFGVLDFLQRLHAQENSH